MTLVLFGSLATGCKHTSGGRPSPSDSDIRHNLVGTWIRDMPKSSGDSSSDILTFNRDGSFTWKEGSAKSIDGTWKIYPPDGGVIYFSSHGFQPGPLKITWLSEHKLKFLLPYETVLPPQEERQYKK